MNPVAPTPKNNALHVFAERHPGWTFIIAYLIFGLVELLFSLLWGSSQARPTDYVAIVLIWPTLFFVLWSLHDPGVIILHGILLVLVVSFLWWYVSLLRQRVPVAGSGERHWWKHGWWLILLIPLVLLIYATLYFLALEFNPVLSVGSLVVAFILAIISTLLLRHHGRTGKIVLSVSWLPVLVIGYIVFPMALGKHGNGNTVAISRAFQNQHEQELIGRAENLTCPENNYNRYCFEPLKTIQSVQNASGRTFEERRLDIHTEVNYRVQVSHEFPGTFTWPVSDLYSSEQPVQAFVDMAGQTMTEEQCHEAIGKDPTTVAMWLDYTSVCPLCGSGSLNERRIYFNQKDEPVCQSFFNYGSWISRISVPQFPLVSSTLSLPQKVHQ